jgi:hypothetical protein
MTVSMGEQRHLVGRVLRASTTGFDCGTRSSKIDEKHTFGSFVKVPLTDDRTICAIGLIYAIRIDDDALARELVMASAVDNIALIDQRENRMVPVEICVINIGYKYHEQMVQSLPPRPPLSLSEVELCTAQEVYEFTQTYDFFRLVLSAKEVPSDELIAAALNYAAMAYDSEKDRYQFKVDCGRKLAMLLSNDLKRLTHVLALIRP